MFAERERERDTHTHTHSLVLKWNFTISAPILHFMYKLSASSDFEPPSVLSKAFLRLRALARNTAKFVPDSLQLVIVS
jgi:hypothetical protein